MGYNWYELALIALILGGIGLAVLRAGQQNPVGTGSLDKRIGEIDGELRGVAIKVADIEVRVEDIDRRAASKNDIKRIEKRLDTTDSKMDDLTQKVGELREAVAAKQASIDHMGRQLDMIFQVIVPKGMK
ncbi:MAG: hypothetical protein IE921_00820 [Rhodobacteraceae bacterium]|nr:hypothetical protein [Paracoccaceae bacterium]